MPIARLPETRLGPFDRAQLHQGGLIGNGILKGEPTEPAKAGVHGDFVAHLPLGEAVVMRQDPHARHDFRIDGMATDLGIEGGDVLPYERQIESSVQAPQDVLGWDERLGAHALDLIRIPGLLADHGASFGQERRKAFPLDSTSRRRFRLAAPEFTAESRPAPLSTGEGPLG